MRFFIMFILGIVTLTLAIVAAIFGKLSLAIMEYREARERAEKRRFRKRYYQDQE